MVKAYQETGKLVLEHDAQQMLEPIKKQKKRLPVCLEIKQKVVMQCDGCSVGCARDSSHGGRKGIPLPSLPMKCPRYVNKYDVL